ncbi:MAG: hypothetical protein IJ867_01900 [Clostridia bacterium]|nr:hypothetical protein [Clostridia bacterium]
MQKKFLRISVVAFIAILLILCGKVSATDDSSNLDDLIAGENTSDMVDNTALGEEEASEEELEEEEEYESPVSSTAQDARNQNQISSGTSTYTPTTAQVQPTQSYSTVASIPEANLSLNNILNVILIAVGVIIILLAIAILIRLKG